MPARQRRSLSEVIAETAPEVEATAAAPPPPVPTGRKPAPVRSTMDLPPDEHAAFLKWAVDASHIIGHGVKGQNVLRAMARRVVADPAWQAQVIDDLRDGKGQP